jgi:hypothetical protein
MRRRQLKVKINRCLAPALRRARLRSGESLACVAVALSLSEFELQLAEESPADVPCSTLYRIMEHYGPMACMEAEDAFIEIGTIGFQYHSQRTLVDRLKNRIHFRLRQFWRKILEICYVSSFHSQRRLCPKERVLERDGCMAD